MTKFMPFYCDEKGFFLNDKGFIMSGNNLYYLVAFFNSNLFKICYRDAFPQLNAVGRELRKVFFVEVSIPKLPELYDYDFERLVIDAQNGSDHATREIEKVLIYTLGLEDYEEFILSYQL